VNAGGNVLGLMPHPERFLTPMHHPSRRDSKANELGLQIIKNIVDHVRAN
jgi:phosphoribosylformylglycinamidine (FGAM) synthase-like amidotransferase family enzyme